MCESCENNCENCNQDGCKKCKNKNFLLNNSCAKNCGTIYFANFDNMTCITECPEGYVEITYSDGKKKMQYLFKRLLLFRG